MKARASSAARRMYTSSGRMRIPPKFQARCSGAWMVYCPCPAKKVMAALTAKAMPIEAIRRATSERCASFLKTQK